jgi:hypothetical protein
MEVITSSTGESQWYNLYMSETSRPSEREIQSNIDAYAAAPWGEVLTYEEIEEFLTHLHQHQDSFIKEFRQSPDEHPYLYVHGINYKDDVKSLIDKEFTGKEAYWRAADKTTIEEALKDCGNVSYIKNVHADKSVGIDADKKPRLQVLPEVIKELFDENQSDSIVLFTHRDTGVFRAAFELDKEKYDVKSVHYEVRGGPTNLNGNHQIDYLTLLVITKK